jgi:hypothetical protein
MYNQKVIIKCIQNILRPFRLCINSDAGQYISDVETKGNRHGTYRRFTWRDRAINILHRLSFRNTKTYSDSLDVHGGLGYPIPYHSATSNNTNHSAISHTLPSAVSNTYHSAISNTYHSAISNTYHSAISNTYHSAISHASVRMDTKFLGQLQESVFLPSICTYIC